MGGVYFWREKFAMERIGPSNEDDKTITSIKSDYYSGVIRLILNCCRPESYMGALILTLCCIDYMKVPISGNTKKIKEPFLAFLENYMSVSNKKYLCAEIREIIWALRCSLVHTFGESDTMSKLSVNFELTEENASAHLEIDCKTLQKNVVISIFHLIGEAISGVEKYFREETNVTLLEEWHKKLFILSGPIGILNKLNIVRGDKIIYGEIHPFLKILDEQPNISIEELAKNITEELTNAFNKSIDIP
jgi:hypothetical protein